MTATDLRLMVDGLLARTNGIVCDVNYYSYEDLFDRDWHEVEGNQHAARLMLARARNAAEYAAWQLKRGGLEEAERFINLGWEYLAEGSIRIARPKDINRYSVPPKRRGRKGHEPKLLALTADTIRTRDGCMLKIALYRALEENPRLAVTYGGRSLNALRRSYYRGKNGSTHK